MATSIGQYTPVFLPGETPSLTEKPGRPQSTGSQRVSQDRSDPAFINTRLFFSFACGSSVPVRVEYEGGAAAWLAGTLVVPIVQNHKPPSWQELWPYRSLFSSLLQLVIRRPLWPVFLVAPSVQALRGIPCLGSLSVVPHVRHIEGPS